MSIILRINVISIFIMILGCKKRNNSNRTNNITINNHNNNKMTENYNNNIHNTITKYK